MFALLRRYLRRVDALYLALCAACSAVSVVVLVSIGQTQLGSNNKASVQLIASFLGIMLAVIFSTVDYRALARAWPLHATVAWGLVLPTLFLHNFRAGVVTIGYDAGGTSNYSWYRVGGMTFQPAELAKISFILTLALHLSRVRGRVNQPKNLLLLLLHIGVPTALIHIQGDDGTALVFLGIGVFMLYAGGLSNWVAGGALAAGVVGGGMLLKLRPGILKGYQFKRILAVITPDDPNLADITYQQNKGAMAIGTGGLTGTGLFTPEHIFVPNAWNDFIFAYLANVLGFVGAAAVLALLLGVPAHADGSAAKPGRFRPQYLRWHFCRAVFADGHQPGHEPAGVARDWCDPAVFLGGRVERGDDVLLRRPGAECRFAGAAQPCGCSGNLVRSGLFAFAGIAHAQAGDQAERGQPNQDEHGTGQPGQRAAQQPAHGVKAPDAVDAPVDAADNGQQQQNLFEYGHKNPSLYASMAQWGGIYS